MRMHIRKESIILLFALFLLVGMSACGTNFPSTPASATPSPAKFSDIPLGKGMDPEPGTDGKSAPLPNGHTESIVIANGLAYIGSDNGLLYAMRLPDGKVQWQYREGSDVSVYAVVAGIVYSAANNVLYAHNASNGALLWRYQAETLVSQVLVADGIVYANTAADNNSSTLSALRASSGTLLWHYTFPTFTPSLMGVINGIVYLSQTTGNFGSPTMAVTMYALRASDAHVLWHTALPQGEGMANGGIVSVNGVLYFATSPGDVYALHTDTGDIDWHVAQTARPGLPPNAPTPVVVNGVVYVSSSQGVFAYTASSGKRMWQYTNGFGGPIMLSPVVVNGVVYFGEPMVIAALRASDGAVLWQHQGEGTSRPLVVTNGMVINDTGPVYALRASDGSVLWQRNITGSGEGSGAGAPEVTGEGVVLIGGDDGTIQAIQASDGKLLWHYAIQEQPVQSPPVYGAYIHFAPSMSYQQALQVVTSLGLKTFADCQPGWAISDNKTLFTNAHEMTIAATVNSAPLWLERLKATTGIQDAEPSGPHSCPAMRPGNGPSQVLQSQVNTYEQVTFASATQYAAALDAVNALGFRLAAPCYEQARAQGNKPTWHSMDQSSTFNQAHTLILSTTFANATTWQSQLRAVQGVVKVDVPFKGGC